MYINYGLYFNGGIFIGVVTTVEALIATKFCGVKSDTTHYKELIVDKHFNSLNRVFIATAHMHHTHIVLDASKVRQAQIMLISLRKCNHLLMLFYKSTAKTQN
jgi:hypothetical protein